MIPHAIPFERFHPASRVVFFSGAGIAAESGIPTFRDQDGLWSRHDPKELASPEGYRKDPELVLSWYAERRVKALQASPNAGHRSISDFQKLFPDCVVITQNVDGLHARAGNREIIELHGNLHRHKCFVCGRPLTPGDAGASETCSCGGPSRPDVVWFGESLNPEQLQRAWELSRSADLFFSVGTSTQVFPAAQLPYEARKHGAYVIEINPHATPFSPMADLSIQLPAAQALPALFEEFHEALHP